MTARKIEETALNLLHAFERDGKAVSSVTIEGKRIMLTFTGKAAKDEFEGIDMRHDKT